MQLTIDAPVAEVDPAAFVPPPLRPRAVGWFPEWGKVSKRGREKGREGEEGAHPVVLAALRAPAQMLQPALIPFPSAWEQVWEKYGISRYSW